MNDDQMLAVIFGISVGLTILLGMGLGFIVRWIIG
jgi:hypothetical protein